jgi:multisubunit Na+/H+ antiporter MnhB subunit
LPITVVTGFVVMIVVNQAGYGGDLLGPSEYLAPKGAFYGVLATLLSFVIVRILFRSQRARKWALLSAWVLTGLCGLLVTQWNLMWGVPPLTLEGAWLWPLAIALLALSFLSFKRWHRARISDERTALEVH